MTTSTVQKMTTRSNAPTRRLTLRKALSPTSYYYNHVEGRRAPRVRYSTSAEAFTEAKRLREQLGLVVRTYAATEITES